MADTNEAGAATEDSVVTKINNATTLEDVLRIYKEVGSERAQGADLVEGAIELSSAIYSKISALIKSQDLSNITDEVLQQMQELGGNFAEAANSLKIKRIEKDLEVLRDTIKTKEKELETYLAGVYVSEHPDEDITQATWESPEYKEWAGMYTDIETRNRRAEIFSINRTITQLENQQKSLMPSSQQKSATQQHQEDSKSPRITAGNVFEHAKKEDLSTWTAEEMRTLLITLNKGQSIFNGVTYDTKALRAKLEKAVVKFSQDFYDNKLVILNMNDAYIWQDVINHCAEHPESEYGSENVEAVKKAKDKVADQITGFEEEFGLNAKQTPEQIAINLKELEKLPDTSDLFAHKTPNYPVQQKTDYQDINTIVNTYKQSGNIPELSVLVGALQNDELGRSDQGPNLKKQLVQWAVERIKLTTKLEKPEDIGNFEKLLSLIPLEENEGLIESKRQLVTTAKEAHEQALPLEHPELQEAYNLLNRLEFQGELSTFGRKKLTQEEQKELRNLILQQVEAETRMFLVNTEPTGVSKDRYIQEFNDRLNKHIFHLVAADAINKGNITPQEIQTQLTKVASRKGPITVNHYSFIGWKIAQNNRFGAAVSRLEIDQRTASVGQYFKGKLANLQQKITQHCSQNPLVAGFAGRAMGVAQACGWAVLYGVAASNPVALGLVSAASLANTCWSFYKKYRTAKAVAESKGQPLSFWGYVKNNKVDTAMSVCGAVMAITGGAAALSAISQPLAGTMMYMASTSMTALMGIKSYKVAKNTFNKTQGSFWKKSAYALGAAGVVFGTYILTRKAAQGVSGAVQGMDFSGDSAPQDTQLSSVSQDNINTPAYDNEGSGFKYHTSESVWEQSGGEIPDTTPSVPEIDPNNLSQEQQHDIDMLFERAPADANEILGDGDWHGSAKLHNMWENGEISQEKMQALLDHAANIFDDKGHFINSDGSIDQTRENAAVEWQRQHDAATKPAPEFKVPENDPEVIPLGKVSSIGLDGLDTVPTLAAEELSLPQATPREGAEITITKIVTDENGDVKIVYSDADGHRHVYHTDTDHVDTKGADKIKFNEDKITIKFGSDGKIILSNSSQSSGDLDTGQSILRSAANNIRSSAEDALPQNNPESGVDISHARTVVEDGLNNESTISGVDVKVGDTSINEPYGLDMEKAQIYSDSNGSIFVETQDSDNNTIKFEINLDGEIVGYSVNDKSYSSDELAIINNKDTLNQQLYSRLEDFAQPMPENDPSQTQASKPSKLYSPEVTKNTDETLHVVGENGKGETVEFSINKDGEYTSYKVGKTEYTQDELDIINHDLDLNKIAYSDLQAEISLPQLQQDLADRGLEGAELIEGSVGDDSNQTTFYNSENGCALIGEDGKISTLVEKDGNYSFSNGDGEKMTFLEAKEFGQKVSDFHTGADGDSGFATEFDETDLNKALYQNYPAEYTDNVADRLGLGGKITHETAQTGVTTFVGENGVGIMAENGEAVAAFLDQEGKLQLVSSSLGQEPKEITNPHLIDKLKQIATTNSNSDIVDAITAKQAEAQQPVGNDGRSGADKTTTSTANGNSRAENSGGKSTQSTTDHIAKLRNGDNPNLTDAQRSSSTPNPSKTLSTNTIYHGR